MAGSSQLPSQEKNLAKGIPNLDDAINADTDGISCTLILVDGDVLRSLVISGLSHFGRETYGVFALQDTSDFISTYNHLVKALGLQSKKKYLSQEDLETLRYGQLLFLTDPHGDSGPSSGMKNLLEALFRKWPSLLAAELAFIRELEVPLVKATKGYLSLTFDSSVLFGLWKSDNYDFADFQIQEFQGWKSLTAQDAKDCFNDLLRHDSSLPSALTDFYRSLLKKERNLTSLIDGLTPCQRTILHHCFQKSDGTAFQVDRLANQILEDAAFHRRQFANVAESIAELTQDFVGSNNVNLLSPVSGLFGSRLLGGKDSGTAREMFVKVSKLTRALFHPDDDVLLKYTTTDLGHKMEPLCYVPILPVVLINGKRGNFPCYNPRDLVESIKRMLEGEEPPKLTPWYKGFKGLITLTDDDPCRMSVTGVLVGTGPGRLEITELPIGVWTQEYKKTVMESLLSNHLIGSYKDFYTDSSVRFVVELTDDQMVQAEAEGLYTFFQLKKTIDLKSLPLVDLEGDLHVFDQRSILDNFFRERLALYDKRKNYLVGLLKAEARRLAHQARFIMDVRQGSVLPTCNDAGEFAEVLRAKGYHPDPVTTWQHLPGVEANFDYLLTMPMNWFTREHKKKLTEELQAKMKEREILKMKTAAQLWRDDLDRFLQLLDEEEAASVPPSPIHREEASKKRASGFFRPSLEPLRSTDEDPDPVDFVTMGVNELDVNNEDDDSPKDHPRKRNRLSMTQYFSFLECQDQDGEVSLDFEGLESKEYDPELLEATPFPGKIKTTTSSDAAH